MSHCITSDCITGLQYCSNRTYLKIIKTLLYSYQANSKKSLLCDNFFWYSFDLFQKASCKIVLDKLLSLLKNKIYEGVFEHLKMERHIKRDEMTQVLFN